MDTSRSTFLTVDDAAQRLGVSRLRVREAVALAIGRNGSELCLDHLRELSRDAEVSVRQVAERAITKLQHRLDHRR